MKKVFSAAFLFKIFAIAFVGAEQQDSHDSDIIGYTETDLVGDISGESNLGNLITDFMLKAFENKSEIAIVSSKFLAGKRINKGVIYPSELKEIVPTKFCLETFKGEELRSMLEESVIDFSPDGEDTSGKFLQVAGLKVEFDLTKENGTRLQSSFVHVDNKHEEILISLKSSQTYNVVLSQYDDNIDCNQTVQKMGIFENVISAFENRTIPKEMYKNLQCRSWLVTRKYKERKLILYFLLCVMSLSGFFTVISNSLVLFVGLKTRRRQIFEISILSLAIVDISTGLLSTPLVCIIYYYSK